MTATTGNKHTISIYFYCFLLFFSFYITIITIVSLFLLPNDNKTHLACFIIICVVAGEVPGRGNRVSLDEVRH